MIMDKDLREKDTANPNIGQRLAPYNLFGVNLNQNFGKYIDLSIYWKNPQDSERLM